MAAHAKRVIPAAVLALLAAFLLASVASAEAASAEVSPADPPSCAEGPRREGDVIVGTPCDDVIQVPATVTEVNAGAGDDKIIAGPITSAITPCPFPGCHLELGSALFEGGPGNDVVWGDRGNDILLGNGGEDWLWGGIGDDVLDGGPDNDKLSGGFGADHLDGEGGSDFIRGDATQDELVDSGTTPGDVDTLSYATAVTPGFGNNPAFPGNPPYPDFSGEHENFPSAGAERGVYLNLVARTEESGNNGGAPNGGGVDEVAGPDFERIIGSPFSDYIVGSATTQEILGGGGADVLIAAKAGTTLNGGADGDDCVGGAPVNCEETGAKGKVTPRDTAEVSVGAMAPSAGFAELYLIGSGKDDEVTVTASGPLLGGAGETVTFKLGAGSAFDEAASAQAGCVRKSAQEAVCELTTPLDSLLVAGLEGDDTLKAETLPATVSLMLLGGNNADELTAGNESDDTLVDGPGNDVLSGLGRDDGLVNNQGKDSILAGDGNDLVLSTVICEGDTINGGPGRDNASWAKYKDEEPGGAGIEPRLDQGLAGRPGAGGEPACEVGESLDGLTEVEDLEGSTLADTLIGNGVENQLLGHLGADSFFSEAANDVILANNGDNDVAINCGEGIDTALIDIHPKFNDPVPVECETVREAEPNNYRVPATPLKPPTPPPAPPPDVKPPRTKVTKHPPKVLWTARRHRRVTFRFVSSEKGSRFRCKVDGKPYRPCASPRTFNLGLGRHAVRIDAIDAAGNADPTPAVCRFRIRQLRHR